MILYIMRKVYKNTNFPPIIKIYTMRKVPHDEPFPLSIENYSCRNRDINMNDYHR